MIVTYFRSSSLGRWEYCEHAYFIEYVLGHKGISNQRAEQGTIVHKVMECLASMKIALQNDSDCTFIVDDRLGRLEFHPDFWLKPRVLYREEIDKINKVRMSKSIYIDPFYLQDGHVRFGEELVEDIFDKAYKHYSEKSIHNWGNAHRKHCLQWTWIALEYADHLYDVRKLELLAAEQQFDIEIKEDWAAYEYEYQGKTLTGHLCVKGTMDLTIKVADDVYEVLDFKTGQRKNWATNKPKTYKDICEDAQLMLYFYALSHIYPDIHIMLTIFYTRNGGPFTIIFEPEDKKRVEDKLRKYFEDIKKTTLPKLLDESHLDFRCNKLCYYAKNNLKGSDTNMCHELHQLVIDQGIDKVIEDYTVDGHDVDYYHCPGS